MAAVTRRQFLAGMAAMGASVGLAACGATPTPTPAATQTPVVIEKLITPTPGPAQPTATPVVVTKVVTPTAGPTSAVTGEKLADKQELRLQQDISPTAGLDPAWAFGTGKLTTLIEALYSGLVYLDRKTGEAKPDIAKSWQASPDYKTWTFTLRDDIKFSDGTPVTAEDFKYTWTRAVTPLSADQMANAGVTSPASTMGSQLINDIQGAVDVIQGKAKALPETSIVAKDKYTFVVTLEAGRPDFILRAGNPGASVVKKDQVEASKKGAIWYMKPIGTGPFLLDSWKPDQELVLVPNPGYYGEKAKLTKITMPIVIDPQTLLVLYDSGELEVIKPSLNDAAEILKPTHRWNKEMHTTNEYMQAILKLYPVPPLDDAHVRKALELAIDKDLICQSVLGGSVPAAQTFMDTAFPGYDMTGVTFNKFDANRARSELAASKYASNYKQFPVKLLVPGGLASREGIAPGTWQLIAAAIQQMWQNYLGIPVEIKVKELESEALDTMHHATYTRWGIWYQDPLGRVERWVNDVKQLEQMTQKNPVYKPIPAPGLEDLAKQISTEPDAKKRWALFRQFEQLRVDYVPYIPLYNNRTYVLNKPYVKGITLGQNWDLPDLNKIYIAAH